MTDRPFLSLLQAWRRSQEREMAVAVGRLPLRARADLPFFVMIALLVAALGLAAYGGLVVVRRLGWLDPVMVTPVADERILDNLRRELPAKPLIAAAWHPGMETLTVSQTGGTLHHLDRATGLWSRERPVEKVPSLGSDIVQLRAGCGGDAATPVACADPASLWALSEQGALARKLNGNWQALIGDSRFIGNDNKPVEAGAATTASLSADGKWLFIGTKAQGGGLYDLKQRHWRPLGTAIPAMPSGRVNAAIWWQDRFVVGGKGGLSFLDPVGKQPVAVRSTAVDGEVADLLVLDDKRLLVLERRPCAVGGEGCLRVQTLTRPDAVPEPMMDERNRFADLDMSGLFFADMQGRSLLVAGRQGVFVYDMALHNWTRLDGRPVLTARREQQTVLYAYTGGAALVAEGTVREQWALPGKQVVQFIGFDKQPAALTEDGELYSLPPGGNPIVLFQTGGSAGDPRRYNAAYAVGDRILMTGPRQALLHDVRHRTYTDIAPQSLPDWLTDGRTRTLVSGSRVFGLVQAGGKATASALDLSTSGSAGPVMVGSSPAVPGPIRQARPWAGGGIIAIDGDGSLHRLDVDTDVPLTGAAVPALDRIGMRDIADLEGLTVFATSAGILGYHHADRRWVGPMATSVERGDIRNLAVAGNRLLFNTTQGHLGEVNTSNPQGTLLIGNDRLQLGAGAPGDVLATADKVYMTGQSGVELYDLSRRTVAQRWALPRGTPAAIVDLLQRDPVTLSDGRLAVGSELLGSEEGRVLSASVADDILSVREKGSARYLRFHRMQPRYADQCLFRNAFAGGSAQKVLDARMIGDGWILVLTDDGLRLYSQTARSWYPVRALSRAVSAIHLVGDHVALVAGRGNGHVQLVPLTDIPRPESCATQPVSLPDLWQEVRGIGIDEKDGRIAWITPDGALSEWRGGTVQQVLATNAGAPATDKLLRVFSLGDKLVFGVPEGLTVYRLADHAWSRVEMRQGATALRGFSDMNLEPDGDGQAVTVRMPNGRTYVGKWNGKDATVALTELRLADVAAFGQSAAGMLDAVSHDGFWTFLMGDRIKRFDPIARSFAPDILLPSSDSTRSLALRGRRLVVVEDGGKRWWVARGNLPTDGVGPVVLQTLFDPVVPTAGQPTMLADDGRVVRIATDGSIEACGPARACQEVMKAAMPLDPGTVMAAQAHGDLVLFRTARGWRLYNDRTRAEPPVPAALSALGAVVEARRDEQLVWLRDAAGKAVALDVSGVLRAQATSVTGFGIDGTGAIWLKGPGLRFSKGELHDAGTVFKLPTGVDARALTIPAGGAPALLGTDRRLRAQEGTTAWQAPPLAPDIDVAKVDEVFRIARTDRWWLRSGAVLMRLVSANCPGRTPPACLKPDLSLPVPTDIAVVGIDDDLPQRLYIRLADGRTLETRMGAAGLEPVVAGSGPLPAAGPVDVWPSWRNRVGKRLDGVSAIDPITDFQVDGNAVRGRTPAGTVPLDVTISPQPRPLPELDAGWLKWERSGRRFLLAGSEGTASLTADQLVRDGQFIFAVPGIAVADAGDIVHVANRFGILSFKGTTLSLLDPQNRFRPQDISAPVAAAHGRFLLGQGGVVFAGGAVTGDNGTYVVTSGDATWTEQLRQARVETTLRVGGQKQAADGGAGFGWDRRAAVALADGRVQVQTELGILPADGLSGADPGWSGRLPSSGQLVSRDGGDLFMVDGGTWHRRVAGRWKPAAAADLLTWDIVTSPRWRWQTTPQGVSVHGVAPASGVATLAFADDQLRAAAWADQGKLIVIDGAGLTIGTLGAVIQAQVPHRPIDIDIDTIQVARPKPDSRMLLARGRGGTFGWDPVAGRFAPLADGTNPLLNRQLLDHPRLRMAMRAGQVITELRLDGQLGSASWQPITLENGFPFDRVNALHVRGNEIFLGTDAGLEVRPLSGDFGFNTMPRLLDMRVDGNGPLSPVLRMGEPVGRPGQLAVRSAGRCVIVDGNSVADCNAMDLADVTRRATAPWWRWHRDAAGQLRGEYLDAAGQGLGLPVVIGAGRLPHDRIRDMVACGGQAVTLWEDGPVTVHAGTGTDLDAGLRFAVPGMARDAQLLCLEQPISEAGLDIPGGLYWITDRTVMRDDGKLWQPVAGEPERAALRQRSGQAIPYVRARLRMVQDQRSGLRFQYRGNDGNWTDLAWNRNRLALDVIERMTVAGGQPWAATPAGFVQFQRGADGTLQIDPNHLVLLPGPVKDCRTTDLETGEDGETWVRCNDATVDVHRGRLDPVATQPVFQKADKDPFSERAFADGSRWQWHLTGRADGKPGQLSASYRGEPVGLSSGRLSLDMIAQIRAFTSGGLEVLTDGAGWYRAAGNGLDDLVRPANDRIDHRAVRRVAVTRGSDGGRYLCLEFGQGRTLVLDPDLHAAESGAVCRDDLGTDGLWRYEQDGEGLQMQAEDRRQRIGFRTLKEGRFTDEIATGLPVPRRNEKGVVEYLVPTVAGVVAFGADARPGGLYLPSFPDMPTTAVPSVLVAGIDGRIAYLGRSGLVGLEDEVPSPLPMMQLLAGDLEPRSLEPGPSGALRLGWKQGGRSGWTLFDPQSPTMALSLAEPVNIATWREYAELRSLRGNANPNLLLGLEGNDLILSSGFAGQSVRQRLPSFGHLRALVRAGRTLLVVGSADIVEIDMAVAFRATTIPYAMP